MTYTSMGTSALALLEFSYAQAASAPHTYYSTPWTLKAKTHVLCEKPVTYNAAELRSLIAVTRENVLFMGRTVNTFPAADERGEGIIDSWDLGLPVVVHIYFSNDFGIDARGGTLLDGYVLPRSHSHRGSRKENTTPVHIRSSNAGSPHRATDDPCTLRTPSEHWQAQQAPRASLVHSARHHWNSQRESHTGVECNTRLVLR
ncbi:hypothetical protein OG21DRAFT_496562 [Imleria badia]|nr:hypothetical protein OG21DRAFT_496562 [Imleria badia]